MAYINFQNCTKQEYDNTIYGQNDVNSCKLYFNNVELQDADNYLEKITFAKRVLPENGKKIFNLDNFIAEEVEIIIHDIDTSIIQDKVRIELGTLVNNTYEYVPMGVYNIQDTPTRNDDKITIKLRDNAVLFDFNYNAKPLLDLHDGTATKMQILQDICSKADVICNVSSFLGDTDLIGIYDNTVTGRMYVAYLAEQAGCIAKIDRNGELIFIPLDNLYTQRIPLSVVSKYIKGTTYTIERLVYEFGTIKFETSSDETLQTLYISSLNPYISTQEQVEDIFDIVDGFEVDTVEILSDIIGNPSIDGYDLIQVYDDESENDVVVFTTLANNTLTYNGKFKSKYKTEIGLEERKENTTNSGEAVFKKTITSEVDRLNGEVTTTISSVQTAQSTANDAMSQASSLNQAIYSDGGLNSQLANLGSQYTSLEEEVSTNWSQTASKAEITLLKKITGYTPLDAGEKLDGDFTPLATQISNIISYVSYEMEDVYNPISQTTSNVGVVTIGVKGNPITLKLANDILYFQLGEGTDAPKIAYIGTDENTQTSKLYIVNADITTQLKLGNFAFTPKTNGSLSFKKVS